MLFAIDHEAPRKAASIMYPQNELRGMVIANAGDSVNFDAFGSFFHGLNLFPNVRININAATCDCREIVREESVRIGRR